MTDGVAYGIGLLPLPVTAACRGAAACRGTAAGNDSRRASARARAASGATWDTLDRFARAAPSTSTGTEPFDRIDRARSSLEPVTGGAEQSSQPSQPPLTSRARTTPEDMDLM